MNEPQTTETAKLGTKEIQHGTSLQLDWEEESLRNVLVRQLTNLHKVFVV